MKNKKIAIIGGGNLGIAIAEGLVMNGYKAENIIITRRSVALLVPYAEKGFITTNNNAMAADSAEIVILAVKPKQVLDIISEIKSVLTADKVLVSVVTGVSMADMLNAAENKDLPIFRAMPNTAIAIRESMTCISSKNTNTSHNEMIMSMFEQLGKAVIINEELMEASTILGACGIAYALRYIRASTQGGIEIGFDSKTASLIASQTVKGAAELLLQLGTHPEAEIDKVTTPQGCTIVGLNEMEHQGFSSALIKGLQTSYKKIAK